jgi:bifunctional lysine-specific demethylase and histidyl-hydroxylase NO66
LTGIVESGPLTRSALSRCVGIPAGEFADDYWGRRALLSPADAPDRYADLFDDDAVDELVSVRGLRTPFIRMAKEGEVLPSSAYTAPGGFGAEVGDQVSSEKVLARFADGATIVLQGLHRTWPPLQEFTRRLAAELGHPAQVNAYITPASSRGFDPHYDVHDVFVLQISGEKRWVIHEPVHENPLADEPWSQHAAAVAQRAAGEPAIDTVLRPGDALYLPRGWLPSATALGGTTVHLTIGMPAYTRTDLARELIGRAVRSDALRGSLPLGIDMGDPEQLADEIRRAADALVAELTSSAASVDRVARTMGRRFADATRPEPVRPLASVARASALAPDDEVRWRDGLAAGVEVDGDRVRLVLRDRTLTLPAACTEALRDLQDGRAVAAGRLPGLDADDGVTVARRLLREGVLVPAGG